MRTQPPPVLQTGLPAFLAGCLTLGAQPSMPTLGQLEAFLAKPSGRDSLRPDSLDPTP